MNYYKYPAHSTAFRIEKMMYTSHRLTMIAAEIYLDVLGPPNSPPMIYKG